MNKRLRATLWGAVGMVTLIALGCSFEPPGAPVWTIEATVPFKERIYRMGELVTDSARMANRGWGLVVSPVDSVLQFESRDTIKYQPIGDRITYNASKIGRYVNRIGTIHVEKPRPDVDTITITEANPELEPPWNRPVAPFDLKQSEDTLHFNIFHWVRVQKGWLTMTVFNTFPFDVQNLTIDVTSIANSEWLGRIVFGQPLLPDSSLTDSLDLSGHLVHQDLLMVATGNSPGTDTPVTITGFEALNILVGITDTDVDSAEAEIAEQRFSNPDQLDLNDSNKIVRAVIKSGHAYFSLRNTTKMRLQSDMVFENIRDEEENTLRQQVVLEPEATGGLAVIDLAGQEIIMDRYPEQALRVSNDVTVEDSRVTRYQDDTYQVIDSSQGVVVEYWTDKLTLSRFTGILDSITVDIPQMTTAVSIPEGLDSLKFTSDTVFVFLTNETAMPLKLNLDIVGRNSRTRREVSLRKIADVDSGRNVITIDNADSLTSALPDTIRVAGWAGLGAKFFPGLGERKVAESEGFAGSVLVRSALKFTIGETKMITDPDSLEGALDYPLQAVELDIRLINSVPLEGTVHLLVGSDTTAMDTVIRVEIPRRALINNRVEAAAETTYTVGLDQREIDLFKRLPIYTRQVLSLRSSEGKTAWVYPSDSLVVQATAKIRYFVNLKGEK